MKIKQKYRDGSNGDSKWHQIQQLHEAEKKLLEANTLLRDIHEWIELTPEECRCIEADLLNEIYKEIEKYLNPKKVSWCQY